MKVCSPKSNGRMNRAFATQMPSARFIVSVGVVSLCISDGLRANDVRRVTFSFHTVEIS
jgi:hypothetical protein